MKQLLTALSFVLMIPPLASAQQVVGDYLDVFTVKVKPEKRADFDAAARRIADANRKGNGDRWTTMQVEFGEGNTLQFVSPRQNYAAIESAGTAFLNAIKSAYGPEGIAKTMADFNSSVLTTRAEIRRRRWDLTVNPPTDADAYSKLVGEARWLRTIRMSVRNGREADFEERAMEAKKALENGSKWVFFVSQAIVGTPGNVYYVTTLQPSLASFDSAPKLSELMGQEAFGTWAKAVAEDEITSETTMMRMVPDLSNPPEAVVKTAPDFWQAKRATAAVIAVPKPADSLRARR